VYMACRDQSGLLRPQAGKSRPGQTFTPRAGSKVAKCSRVCAALHDIYTLLCAVLQRRAAGAQPVNEMRPISVSASDVQMKCARSRVGCGHLQFLFCLQIMAASIAHNVGAYFRCGNRSACQGRPKEGRQVRPGLPSLVAQTKIQKWNDPTPLVPALKYALC